MTHLLPECAPVGLQSLGFLRHFLSKGRVTYSHLEVSFINGNLIELKEGPFQFSPQSQLNLPSTMVVEQNISDSSSSVEE